MRQILLFSAATALLSGCGSSESSSPDDSASDSARVMTTENLWGGSVIAPTTHLQDTIEVTGDMILFLRPDFPRLESFSKVDSTILNTDDEFGKGISGTFEGLGKNAAYSKLKMEISICRYVKISDCKNGPVVLDRDSINFGYVITSPGKEFISSSEVHESDYIGEIEEFFQPVK